MNRCWEVSKTSITPLFVCGWITATKIVLGWITSDSPIWNMLTRADRPVGWPTLGSVADIHAAWTDQADRMLVGLSITSRDQPLILSSG